MQMLEQGSIWSILKHHHPNKRLILFAVANKIDKIFVVHPRESINLHQVENNNVSNLRIEDRNPSKKEMYDLKN